MEKSLNFILGLMYEPCLYITHYKVFENDVIENIATSPRGQGVKTLKTILTLSNMVDFFLH